LFTSAVDPFSTNGLGDAGKVLVKDTRLDNLVAYISPNWSGFSFVTGFTNSYSGNESRENKSTALDLTDARVWAFAPQFAQGPVFVALNFHQARTNESDALKSVAVAELYASYDFGPVKLSSIFGQRKTKLDGGADLRVRQGLIGVSVPVGSGKILTSYSRRTIDSDDAFLGALGDEAKLGRWALGYEHSLSKRTTLYTQYAHQTQNRQQKALSSGGLNSIVGATSSGVWTDGYRQGLAVGVRHDF
jgi:predicted porin